MKTINEVNKYQRLLICSIILFGVFSFINYIRENKNIAMLEDNDSIQMISDEIVYYNEGKKITLYRFVPVEGGGMDFNYKTEITQSRYTSSNSPVKQDSTALYESKKVNIPDFLIGDTPVTEDLWELVMNNIIPDSIKHDFDISYVEDKTLEEWNDFIKKLNKKTGCKFQLPTSYEWEYAARGGPKSKNYKYAGSDSIDEVAFFSGNAIFGKYYPKQKKPNELGLYDMSGGVWELTSTSIADIDPIVGMFDDFKGKNIPRGGNYRSSAEECETKYI